MTAKSAPYPPCTVIRQLAELKYQDPARMLRRVTQPPHIAGPLGVRVRRKTIVSLYEKNLLYKINFSHFAGILPSGQLYRDRTTSTHLEGLMHSAA
jgi:hypothetical protein